MFSKHRAARHKHAPRVESLETRNLLSVLINSQPTLEVIPRPSRVRATRDGITILQPARIAVTGTAQPPADNVQVLVEIYAKDVNGNILNGGAPLATARTDFSGQYHASFRLPTAIRKDINILFAREVAVGTIDSTLQINPTTLSGLTGNLAINGTTLSNLTATINNPQQTSTLTGSIANESLAIGGLAGLVEIGSFPIDLGAISGSGGPATGVFIGGTGIIEESTGTLTGTGTTPASQSSLAGGAGSIAATNGTFIQTGTALIAATDGTSTMHVVEYAVSNRVQVAVHQSRRNVAPLGATGVKKNKAVEAPKAGPATAKAAAARLRKAASRGRDV